VPFQSQWLDFGHFETVVVTYMQALVFEQKLRVAVHVPQLPDTIEQAKALSMAFEIIFRTFAQSKGRILASTDSPPPRSNRSSALNALKQE
jgi:hypothetical protein